MSTQRWSIRRWLIAIGLVYLVALVVAALFLLLGHRIPCPPAENLLTVLQRNNIRQEFRIPLLTADLVLIHDRLSEYAGFPVGTEDDLVRVVEESGEPIHRFTNLVIPESFTFYTEGVVGPLGAARGLISEAYQDRADETQGCALD